MADDTRAEVESHRTQDSRAELKETRLAAGAAEQREDGRRKEFAADLVPREGRLFEDPHRSALTHGGKCGHPTTWTARISTPPRRHQFQNSRCRGICSEPAGGAGGARLRSIRSNSGPDSVRAGRRHRLPHLRSSGHRKEWLSPFSPPGRNCGARSGGLSLAIRGFFLVGLAVVLL